MKIVSFTIPGPPKGKARARTLKTGHSYTPADTVQYQNLVKLVFRERVDNWVSWEGEVELTIWAYFPIPKATSKRKQILMLGGQMRPKVRPDVDNIAKIIMDALNGIAYRDDSQIVNAHIYKQYGDVPKVEVYLRG